MMTVTPDDMDNKRRATLSLVHCLVVEYFWCMYVLQLCLFVAYGYKYTELMWYHRYDLRVGPTRLRRMQLFLN